MDVAADWVEIPVEEQKRSKMLKMQTKEVQAATDMERKPLVEEEMEISFGDAVPEEVPIGMEGKGLKVPLCVFDVTKKGIKRMSAPTSRPSKFKQRKPRGRSKHRWKIGRKR